jgi:hypothetical protein
MANKPEQEIDEEELIRRRDGVSDSATLDVHGRRALADARLRGLAFALGSGPSAEGAEDIEDVELLDYLLNDVPEKRRTELEKLLAGDAVAFGRLMTLRSGFDSQMDRRDREQADHPSRKIRRHTAAHLHVRSKGDILQFSDADFAAFEEPAPMFGLRARMRRAEDADRPRFNLSERAAFRLDSKSGHSVAEVANRLQRDFRIGREISGEIQALLARWEEIRGTAKPGSEIRRPYAEEGRIERRVGELLRELSTMIRRMGAEIDPLAPETDDDGELQAVAFTAPLEVTRRVPPLRQETGWRNSFEVMAGRWRVQLSGAAHPRPHLTVHVISQVKADNPEELFLTLVRPANGFELLDCTNGGGGSAALQPGDSVLLIQGEEVWHVNLSLLG